MAKDHSPARPTTWNSNRRGQVPAYVYKTINELFSSPNADKFYNLYGVIVDGRSAEKSKGSDYFCILRIVDPSYCHGEGLKVTLFHHDQKQLPEVNQWDIIRLHRVRANSFQASLSLINAKGWSWVSWKGNTDDDIIESAKSSSNTCTIVDEDVDHVRSLRTWIAQQGYSTLDVVRNEKDGVDQKLSEIKSGSFFNLACQVIGMAKIRDNYVILKVWDGTIPSHKITPGDYGEECEIQILANIEGLDKYVVDVSVYDNHVHSIEDDQIEIGSFVRFYNLHASPQITDYHSQSTSTSERCSDLFLHGGTVFNRGLARLEEDSDVFTDLQNLMMEILKPTPPPDSAAVDSDSEKVKKSPVKDASSSPPSAKKRKLHGKRTVKSPVPSSCSDAEFSTPPQEPMRNGSLGTQSLLLQASEPTTAEPTTADSESQNQDTHSLLMGLNSQQFRTQIIISSKETEKSATDSPRQQNNQSLINQNDIAVQVGEPQVQPSLTGAPGPQYCPSPSKLKDFGLQVGPPQIEVPLCSSTPANYESNGLDSAMTNSNEISPNEMRCTQKSATVVSQECLCYQLNSISEIIKAGVPLQESRLFRVRAKVFRCSDLESIVCHYCPITNIRLPAKNDGKKIELPDDIFQYFSSWRRNYLSEVASSSGESTDSLSVISTQWPVVTGSGSEGDHVDVDIESYECVKDGSKWETLKFKSNISRKRKFNRRRFNILYREDEECSINLKAAGKNFQRVVRVCSKDALISQNIPAAVYQDRIFYYCTPACVDTASIPSLEQEAHAFAFDPKKPRWALGCPLMPIRFHLKMQLEDQSDVLEVTLKDQHAVDFFNQITPEEYLLNTNGCRSSISELMNNLVNNDEDDLWAEMVIEKRSRKPLPGNYEPVLLYEVVKTTLVT